jgi:CO/xanthine dehydrogenase Mo-binding subunit
MTAVIDDTLVGRPIDRVDGPAKAAGAAPYPSDVSLPGEVFAALAQSTIAAGRISRIDLADAQTAPGVLTVITHDNAPALAAAPMTPLGPAPRYPFTDDRIVHYGQHVAMVVAETREQALAAARLVAVEYEPTTAQLHMDSPEAPVEQNMWGLEVTRGDVDTALASAGVVYDQTFAIAPETNNPMGLFATVAKWDGDRLVVYDSTQWPMIVRQALATVFGVPDTDVRVLVQYLGGGFGNGLRAWPHTILTALAARIVHRPVKLVLTRPQMFTSVGHRPQSTQRLRLGANTDGRLVAIDHDTLATIGAEEANISALIIGTPHAYDIPNIATHERQVRLNIPNPGAMRAPGHAEGNFALETALDELSYQLAIDPIELRLRNFALADPQSGLPWSSNALRECYRVGAKRFGWHRRNPEPETMRDGNWLIGYGMAGVTFGWYAPPCQTSITINRAGTAHVRAAATDIGTGTYTIATQLAAELLGLGVEQVNVEIGDSDLPPAPQSGGSGLATAFSGAIQVAAENLLRAFVTTVADDDRSPLHGRDPDKVTASGGRIHLVDDPSVGERYTDILSRHGLDQLTAHGAIDLTSTAGTTGVAPAGGFAARFAEVRVDEDLGVLRINRIVSVVDGGRILNEKTARSQIIGGTVMGVGMTMLEENMFDTGTGRITNATFSDYLIPVHADVPDLDVVFVGGPDTYSPTGVKGLGEIGVAGVAAAIGNAVYHATGRRVRSLPITIDQLV